MQAGQGTFIAIEGTDGSGKGTQFQKLAERLAAAGYDVAAFDFPQYDQESSYFVRQYLNGNYGSADEVGPYTGSLFYALDRYQAAPQIRKALNEGKVVLANRFVGSNMAHQGTKFRHVEERRGYFIWLDNLEFEMLRTPRPALSFVLRVPATIAQKLVDKKDVRTYTDKKRDLHEADLAHMQKAVEVYDDMCQLFPKDFVRLECVQDGKLLPVDAIADMLWQQTQPLLKGIRKNKTGKITAQAAKAKRSAQPVITKKPAEQPEAAAHSADKAPYYTPANLSPALAQSYHATMNQLFGLHAEIAKTLTDYLASINSATASTDIHTQVYAIAQAVLPVALVAADGIQADAQQHNDRPSIAVLSGEHLPDNYGQPVQPVQLSQATPRNELDVIADMLYGYSSLPLREIRAASAAWPFERKLTMFDAYAHDAAEQTVDSRTVWESITYRWDILGAYEVFRTMQVSKLGKGLQRQTLTPRYGYEVPELIESAGLTDQFETCFELSLKLYSQLQQEGYHHDAQYATLLGHRVRWQIIYSAQDMVQLNQLPGSSDYHLTIHQMYEKVAEAHPAIAEALKLG